MRYFVPKAGNGDLPDIEAGGRHESHSAPGSGRKSEGAEYYRTVILLLANDIAAVFSA